MSDFNNANELLHGSLFDSAEEIWAHELLESTPATVTRTNGITYIDYTRLLTLPSYYSGEEEVGVFVPISVSASDIWEYTEMALGTFVGPLPNGERFFESGFEAFFSNVANVVFQERPQLGDDVGAITFGGFNNNNPNHSAQNSSGFVKALPNDFLLNHRLQSDVFFDFASDGPNNLGIVNGSASNFYSGIVHEIGHALGLRHPNSLFLTGEENTVKYTLMVVNDSVTYKHPDMYFDTGRASQYVKGLQLYDIAAIQEIYGRNYDTRDASTTYDFKDIFGDFFIYSIWDGGGQDTIDATGYTNGAEIDLRQGHFSSIGKTGDMLGSPVSYDNGPTDRGNVSIAFYTIIENAKGTSHNDRLIGNAWNNKLEGGAGNDRLFGDGSILESDSLLQTLGYENDTGALKWEAEGGTKYANDKSGRDTLIGGAGNDFLYGGKGGDTLRGGTDDDYLDGGNDDHTDILEGGTGSDTYILHGDHSVSPDRIIDPVQLPGDQDKIVVDGVEDPNSVMYARFGKDLYIFANGGLIAVVKDQYKDPGNKLIKTLEIKDDAGTTLGTDDLDNIPKEKTRKTGGPTRRPPEDPPEDPPPPGPDQTGAQAQYQPIAERRDPLVIDFDGDGLIEVTNPATASIYFDMDNDGFAEAVSWVSTQDALLVRDLNNNGNIDNANELFGTSTLNGFTVLKSIDSNNDDVPSDLSRSDWSNMKVTRRVGARCTAQTKFAGTANDNFVQLKIAA